MAERKNIGGCLKYVMRILRGIRPEELKKCLNLAQEKSGKGKVRLFLDMLWCSVRYGAGYHDYVMFAFYGMKARSRKTYVTRMKNKKLIVTVNDPDAADIFDRKVLFDPRFAPYLGRGFLLAQETSPEEFGAFIRDKDVIFAKPDVGESGKGIERLKKSDFPDTDAMYRYVKSRNFGVLEEELIQHEALKRVYPHSVNSLRIVTLLTGGPAFDAHCVYAVVKFGGGGKFVDNLENGGMFCPLNPETGEICGVAHTAALKTLDCHPDTGVPFLGYRIPFVREAIALCKKAAMEEPRMRYLGWDVCITPEGPAIIEGNDYPGYDFWQQPEHTPDKTGLWPYYLMMIPELDGRLCRRGRQAREGAVHTRGANGQEP